MIKYMKQTYTLSKSYRSDILKYKYEQQNDIIYYNENPKLMAYTFII